LRVKHPNFGKIVTIDGAVYVAQEIVFHTPSEHQIDGNYFDMEMQVIHYGKSIGDTIKQVVLSFLFRAKPGIFNKFIEKLDFFDLPNPTDKVRELSQTLFIPHIFLDSDDEDLSIMTPFSFYTYQGSITTPPCNEQTIHYIASRPIDLSNTALELFKEALRVPDRMDAKGNIVVSNILMENNRSVQALNGRTIFHYDHLKYNCPDFRKKNIGQKFNGHYEKRTKEVVEYVYVNGFNPSGMPGSFVVSEKEANGTGI
jgi:carbonic anhydrase